MPGAESNGVAMSWKNCLLSGSLALLALGRAVGAKLSDVPTKENFVRRATAKATVMGSYVYIDGGEISQLEDGEIRDRTTNQVNSTLAIDISQSWTTDSVAFIQTYKTGPQRLNVHLWTDAENNVFYSWAGKFFLGINMTKTELWKFSADGRGSGTWSAQPPASESRFGALTPGEFSAVATAHRTGYVLGGIASGWTQLYRASNQVIPGMATFDMTTHEWRNYTVPISPFDTIVGASAEFVPTYGPNGLIFVLGGDRYAVDAEPNDQVATPYSFTNITFFDPKRDDKRYWQTTTGEAPESPRTLFCTAGFQAADGRYDIFLFGGVNRREKFTYEDAYVLSIPGFVWTKLPKPPAGPRAEHSCVAIGKRQVLSIGGADTYGDKKWTDPDPAPQGLLVYDMTAMKWTDAYDASADAYESPETVKSWYAQDSLKSVQWSSDEVAALFATASTSPGSNSTTDSNKPTETPRPSSGTPVGAIVGGVVGGIAGLAIAAAVAWLLVRRRRQKQANVYAHVDPNSPGHPPAASAAAAAETKYIYSGRPQEVSAESNHHEMYSPEYGASPAKTPETTTPYKDAAMPPATAPVELDGGGIHR